MLTKELEVLKVLLIEDEKDLREITIELIKDSYQIDEAENGFVAFEKLNSHNYDIIITDLRLGHGPSGLDILNTISSGKYPSIKKVIFCSSSLPQQETLNELHQNFLKAKIELHIEEKLTAYPKMAQRLAGQ